MTSVSLVSYVSELLSDSNVSLEDSAIMAGMDDIVSKLMAVGNRSITEFYVSTPITTIPVTVQNVGAGILVYRDNQLIQRRETKDNLTNAYSLFNDGGITPFYYVEGTKLYIEPFLPFINDYTATMASYGVSAGRLTFPSRFIYPLALFCASDKLFKDISQEQSLLNSQLSEIPVNISLNLTDTNKRLTADDVELASAEMQKVRLAIDSYSATTQAEAVKVQMIQIRVGKLEPMVALYSSLRALYIQYFQAGAGEGK